MAWHSHIIADRQSEERECSLSPWKQEWLKTARLQECCPKLRLAAWSMRLEQRSHWPIHLMWSSWPYLTKSYNDSSCQQMFSHFLCFSLRGYDKNVSKKIGIINVNNLFPRASLSPYLCYCLIVFAFLSGLLWLLAEGTDAYKPVSLALAWWTKSRVFTERGKEQREQRSLQTSNALTTML